MKRPLLLLPLLALALPALAQDPATNAATAQTTESSSTVGMVDLDSVKLSVLLDQAREAYATGQCETANWLTSEILRFDPTNAPALEFLRQSRHVRHVEEIYAPRTNVTVVIGLRCLVSDTSAADPFAALPNVRDAERPADAPAVRARVVETEAFAPLLAAAKNIRVHDDIPRFTCWGRRDWVATVSHAWRVPKCFSTTVSWNVVAEEPDTNGLSRVSLKATLSGNPDPDAERTSAQYAAAASLTLGGADQLLLGPVPASNISTNPNAIAWFAVTVAPAWLSDEDPFSPDFHTESAEPELHAKSAKRAE